jgi:hypothetical protein
MAAGFHLRCAVESSRSSSRGWSKPFAGAPERFGAVLSGESALGTRERCAEPTVDLREECRGLEEELENLGRLHRETIAKAATLQAEVFERKSASGRASDSGARSPACCTGRTATRCVTASNRCSVSLRPSGGRAKKRHTPIRGAAQASKIGDTCSHRPSVHFFSSRTLVGWLSRQTIFSSRPLVRSWQSIPSALRTASS